MNFELTTTPLIYIGNNEQRGSYILRIDVRDQITMPFGRFKRGKIIDVQPGEYLYIGSAMARQGSTSLAKRLLRHATRSGKNSPHVIRATLLSEFPMVGLADVDLLPPAQKTLRWNVDHLLDTPTAELVSTHMVRSSSKLEPYIGDMLEADPSTVVFERGLGAGDRPGSTYLLRVEADEDWWHGLAGRLELLHQAALCSET